MQQDDIALSRRPYRPSCPRNRRRGWRCRNSDRSATGRPKFMIETWFGQVGSLTNTRRSGWPCAPVPAPAGWRRCRPRSPARRSVRACSRRQGSARHGFLKVRLTGQRRIGLGGLGLQHPALGFLDGAHDRGVAIGILVDAHAKVDLALSGIGPNSPIRARILSGACGFRLPASRISGCDFGSGKLPHSAQLPS